MGTAGGSRRERDPSRNEIVQTPVIARRRSDRCEGSALLRNRFDAHDAEKLVKPSPSVGGLFHFKPSLQCRLLALSRPIRLTCSCPLFGVNRKSRPRS